MTSEHPDTLPSTPCPSSAELAEHLGEARPEIDEHVASCRRCRTRLRLLGTRTPLKIEEDETSSPSTADAAVPTRGLPRERAVGEIVALVVEGLDELLLAAALDWREEAGAEVVMVAPLSTETAYAAEWDLLLPADDPVGYKTIAEVWNHGLALAEQVSDRLGVLPEECIAELVTLWSAYFADEPSADARVGPPVLEEDDPRVEFQDREQERAAIYFAPSAALLLEPNSGLGALVAEWRAEHGYNERELAVELGWNLTLVRSLEDESLDAPPVEVEELARVLVFTGLDLDERRVRAAVEASARRWTAFAETYDQGAAAARTAGLSAEARERALSRRGGKRRRDPEEHERAVRHFLGELRDAVGERQSR